MDFNSIEEMRRQMIKNIEIGARKALEYGQERAYEYIINEWYRKHHNEKYIRLNLMIQSLKIKITTNNDGVEAILYISDELHPPSNSYNRNPISFEELYEWFANGFGGETEPNKDIMEYTYEELIMAKSAFDIIKHNLIEEGFDFQ
jgi:hypothetical protein